MARPKDDTKIAAIFEATLRLVLKTGFDGLKMADVARAAGLATGTVYIYFKNKEVLINQLFLAVKSEKTSKLMAVYDARDSFEVSFGKLWHNYLDISLAEPERMLFIEQFAHTSHLTKKTIAAGDALLQPLAQFIEGGIRKKILRKVPTPVALGQLMGPVLEVVKLEKDGVLKLTQRHKEELYEMAWRSVTV
jgi:AcrR family transcriptional regulator